MDSTSGIRWGVIGAGDVVIRKSGLPLQNLPDSRWLALYRRNPEAAREVAERFGVPRVCSSVSRLLEDHEINAVYVATPPSSHAEYAIAALEAGKDVYLEKPMARNLAEAERIRDAVKQSGRKLVMAHYRRGLPAFEAVGQMLSRGDIGIPRFARIRMIQSPLERTDGEALPWRVRPEISGGGLFHDLAPHQLDLCLNWFGNPRNITGISRGFGEHRVDSADNYVSCNLEFESGVLLDGFWCFAADSDRRSSEGFSIYGTEGRISFSFFGDEVCIERGDVTENLTFKLPEWLQEPMLKRTVDYFLDRCENPCSADIGVQTMQIIDTLTVNS